MDDTRVLIASLGYGPRIITGLVREVPAKNLKRRPSADKWSAHEHACHISGEDAIYLARLDLMLSEADPYIKSDLPSAEEQAGSMLNIDLDEALDRYARERTRLVERFSELSDKDWQKTAKHEAFSHYSVFILFRDLLLHEMLHAYRIEELLLKKDW